MELNPQLESVVETYAPERLQALLMWFCADAQSLGNQAERLSAILDEAETMDINDCYNLIQALNTKDMVEFAVVNEFGPAFANKNCFSWLSGCIQNHLAAAVQEA